MFITQSQFSPEFTPVAEQLNNLSNKLQDTKTTYLLIRMEMIGVAEDFKRQYPQRSAEARYIASGYKAEGWDTVTVSKSYKAYTTRQRLLSNCNPEFQALGETASYTQLYELATANTDSTVTFDAAMYLKKNGFVPSTRSLSGHKAGYFTPDFESMSALNAARKKEEKEEQEETSVSALKDSNTAKPVNHETVVTDHERRQAEVLTGRTKPPTPAEALYLNVEAFVQLNRKEFTDADKTELRRIISVINNYI